MNLVDIHTHILPGIDDGADNWEMSLDMVRASWKAGVRTIIATPHYLPWKKHNHTDDIELLCRELMYQCAEREHLNMRILPGQEIFFHSDMAEGLRQGKILSLAYSRYILVEFETGASGHKILDGLDRLRGEGYYPILAHMERYASLRSGKWLQELKKREILLQMNMEAIEGMRFDPKVYWCRRQVAEGTVDFMASDMHNLTSRPPLRCDTLRWMEKHVALSRRKCLFDGLPKGNRSTI